MRQNRSSKHEIKEMDIEKINKLKEEPHLSGAYIRSLVKQLTSSKTKDSMNPKELDSNCVVDGDAISPQNLSKFGGGSEEKTQQQQPQQHKKQVRRRLHTSRPYQERLLNMAEARREIVTALKFHRAAMKQASEQRQQQQPQSPSVQPPGQPCVEQEEAGRMKSRRNSRIYPSATSNFFNYLDNLSYTPNLPHHHPSSNPFTWSASPNSTTIPVAENLNFTLPNQTLGLNLNIHDFNNIETSLYHNPSFYSTSTSNSVSSPSSSSSPTLCTGVDQEVPGSGSSGAVAQMEVEPPVVGGDVLESSSGTTSSSGGLHAAMDDEEMAEIRSIGEQHQMEWNDTINLVTSAWWFKFLKTMELGGGPDMKAEDDDHVYHPFDEVTEFPSWLSVNDNETCLQQHFDDYFQNPALPCMDIGEFEGMDGEWLA